LSIGRHGGEGKPGTVAKSAFEALKRETYREGEGGADLLLSSKKAMGNSASKNL